MSDLGRKLYEIEVSWVEEAERLEREARHLRLNLKKRTLVLKAQTLRGCAREVGLALTDDYERREHDADPG